MDIVEESNTTLRRIEQNDPKLLSLAIVNRDHSPNNDSTRGSFWLHEGADLSRLGNAIGNNKHLDGIALKVGVSSDWTTLNTTPLIKGLQRSNTIKNLSLNGNIGIGDLNEYGANISSPTRIGIFHCDLRGGMAGDLASAMHVFPNLNDISVYLCKIDDESLNQFASGIKGISSLRELYLLSIDDDTTDDYTGSIDGTEGAEAIVSLFQDPKCNINKLVLSGASLKNESIQIIVNGLIGNIKLKNLEVSHDKIERSGCESIVTLLQDPSCNITSLDLRWCGINNESLTKIVTSLIGNTKLEHLDLSNNSIGESGCGSIVTLLQDPSCNLTELHLGSCGLMKDLTTTILSSLVGNTKMEKLDLSNNGARRSDLFDNSIGRSGCESVATLLQDPKSNIRRIDLARTKIDDDCATILARSLVGNTKLECLDLSCNPDITIGFGWNAFIGIFLNYSNTTLYSLGKEDSGEDFVPDCLATLLKLNFAVDMEPLFELDTEDDERNLKALPHVIDWFDRRARETTRNRLVPKCIRTRKLSAIFQFARAMPVEFVPPPTEMLLLHEEAKDQLKEKSLRLERRIANLLENKKELDDEIKVKGETIKHLQDSIGSFTKKRKHGV